MFEFPAEPGQKIIAEGDDGDNFYVIENGVYDVYKVNYGYFWPDIFDLTLLIGHFWDSRDDKVFRISMAKKSKSPHTTIRDHLVNWH